MKYGSAFAGIGGFDIGLDRVGMTCAWQIESDPVCQRVLKRHWPEVPRYSDIRQVDGSQLEPVDLICAGFPCQDLSVAGRQKGIRGERSGLFFDLMRVVRMVGPRYVLLENVPGLLSQPEWMGAVLGELADSGFDAAWRVLDAQFFGVAQRRRRVFIVGCLGDPARAAAVLLEPESCDRDTPPQRTTGARVAASLTSGTANGSGVNPPGRRGEDDINLVARSLNAHDSARYDGDSDTFIPEIAPTMCSFNGPRGTTTNPQFQDGSAVAVAFNPYRTLEKDGSITSGFAERPTVDALHGPTGNKEPLVTAPMAVRRLTPTECERLQGFDDGWTAGEVDSARYRMLGNAVCVPVATWIGTQLLAALDTEATRA